MFTGIVDHCGQVISIKESSGNFRITIKSVFNDLTLGESIAIDGACLTVTQVIDHNFIVDLSPETLRLTTASQYVEGFRVNLERSLRLMDRLGGHFVTGHVDQQCEVSKIAHFDEFTEMTFAGVIPEHRSFLVKKGSIAINGVSLTLNDVAQDSFKVMLIPHTLQKTNLSALKIGQKINVEYDYLAKLVLNQTKAESYAIS